MTQERKIKLALAYLQRHGYFTQNMWHVNDVKILAPDCSDHKAQEILFNALTNGGAVEHIFDLILSQTQNL